MKLADQRQRLQGRKTRKRLRAITSPKDRLTAMSKEGGEAVIRTFRHCGDLHSMLACVG